MPRPTSGLVAWLLGGLLLWGATSNAMGQSVRLELRLHAPGLGDSLFPHVVGNDPQVGNWDPVHARMRRAGGDDWTFALEMEAGGSLEYKYTLLGRWEREALDAQGNVPANRRVAILRDSTVHDTVTAWKNGQAPAVAGGVTGWKEQFRVHGKGEFPGRDIVVWLPPDYRLHAGRRYPVLYMHDGQNVFDPATSSFGRDWRADETCDSLMRLGRIPPMIVVGIYNGTDRSAEYNPLEKGAAYADWLLHVLKPFIDGIYRTRPGRGHTYTGGSSMGGLIAFALCWEHPEAFSKAICMSPAFQYPGFDYVSALGEGSPKRCTWYIDNGGVELEQVLQPGCEAMMAELSRRGYREGRDYHWVHAPSAAHNEPAWAARLPQALLLLFGK